MFGTKLRTWMEAHIVRSKKKKDRKKGEKGFDSTCNSPRNHAANRSPALHQVHPVDSLAKNVDGIGLHGEAGRRGTGTGTGTATTASSATSAGTGSVNLSSPESAYSTGYSTDGTSPGTSYPPEYYINIRTGTHYFQSNANSATPAASNDNNNGSGNANVNNNNNNNNNNVGNACRPKRSIDAADSSNAVQLSGRARGHGHARLHDTAEPSTSGSSSAAAFARGNAGIDGPLPRDAGGKARGKIGDRLTGEDEPSRQPKRPPTESFSAESSGSNLAAPPSSIPPPLLSPTIQSPRERSRIRTNPWLSANSSGSSTAGFKSRLNLDDTSSGSGLKLTESSGSASDVNASSAREGRARREFKQESLSAGRSPINQNWRIASGMEIRPKIALAVQRRSSTSSTSTTSNDSSGSNASGSSSNALSSNEIEIDNEDENENENGTKKGKRKGKGNGNGSSASASASASSVTRSARSSEDDITLNEMMGKFDESYVYEKETDILSDSDPTDCEDYIESLSDVDAARDAGDENDPLDNDFDYIDNGSFLDLDNLDCTGRFPNTGHCTYFAFTGELARRSSKLRESLLRRRNKDDAAILQRTISAKNSAKRQIARHKKLPDEKQLTEKRKRRSSQRRKCGLDKRETDSAAVGVVDDDEDEAANLNRALVERMLLKNSGFNQGSRSVGGTPICLRRKKHDANKTLSPMRSADEQSCTVETGIANGDLAMPKRRSNSVSYANGNLARRRVTATGNTYMTTFASEIALMEADKEADKKYRELILEAENILVNMQKNQSSLPVVPSPSRKLHNGLANKRVELIKNTELNIELALSKSRNSQPELQSGSIKDLEHTSPKRQQLAQQPSSPMRRFAERTASSPIPPAVTFLSNSIKRSIDSPLVSRRAPSQRSPDGALLRCTRPRPPDHDQYEAYPRYDGPQSYEAYEGYEPYEGYEGYEGRRRAAMFGCNGVLAEEAHRSIARSHASFLASRSASAVLPRGECRVSKSSNVSGKEEGVTSSSSDSEERCDVGRRAPHLLTFRSVDMGPIKEGSSYCPQSEPVKRKVYAGSATYGRIRKTLGEQVTVRNSDGDTGTDDTDDSRRCLKEKVARLRQERLAAASNGVNGVNGMNGVNGVNGQDAQMFQQQLSQLRRQMLMQTIEGLKRSLEDQSATLKQTCLEPVMTERVP